MLSLAVCLFTEAVQANDAEFEQQHGHRSDSQVGLFAPQLPLGGTAISREPRAVRSGASVHKRSSKLHDTRQATSHVRCTFGLLPDALFSKHESCCACIGYGRSPPLLIG